MITEDRQDLSEYLETDEEIELSNSLPRKELVADLAGHTEMQDPFRLIRHLYQAWFGSEAPEEIGDTWRVELGSQLRSHEFLAALLGALNGNIRPVDEVVTHLQRSFPELGSRSEPEIRNLLQGFMALLAFARRVEGETDELRPFLSIRVHFWDPGTEAHGGVVAT